MAVLEAVRAQSGGNPLHLSAVEAIGKVWPHSTIGGGLGGVGAGVSRLSPHPSTLDTHAHINARTHTHIRKHTHATTHTRKHAHTYMYANTADRRSLSRTD